MKKFLPYIVILVVLTGLFSNTVKVSAAGICIDEITSSPTSDANQAACEGNGHRWEGPTSTPDASNNQSYHLLEPIPDPTTADGKPITDFPVGETGALGKYLNLAIKLFIGLCAVAAVVMIVIGGIEYSTTELISTKAAAKDRIQGAILGLLLALGSYAILFTINPDLLNTEVDIGGASITSSGEATIKDLDEVNKFNNGGGYSGGSGALPKEIAGTICDKNVVTKYATDAGLSITEGQAKAFACLAAAESSCNKNNTSYTNAKGAFQIITSIHQDCINRFPVCQTAGIYSLPCNTAVAVCVMKKSNGSFKDWTTDYIQKNGTYESHAKQRKCAVDNGQPVGVKCLDIRYRPARPC